MNFMLCGSYLAMLGEINALTLMTESYSLRQNRKSYKDEEYFISPIPKNLVCLKFCFTTLFIKFICGQRTSLLGFPVTFFFFFCNFVSAFRSRIICERWRRWILWVSQILFSLRNLSRIQFSIIPVMMSFMGVADWMLLFLILSLMMDLAFRNRRRGCTGIRYFLIF